MARIIRADARAPGVIPKAVADAGERARAILAAAEQQAAALRARAEAEGRASGRAEHAATLLALTEERDRALAAIESQAVELALLAAKRVIGRELEQRPALVAEMVAPLLLRLRRAKTVTLRVHPDDRPALEASLAKLRSAESSGALRVEPDPSLSRGDCVVHSELGSLDARIDTQLAALRRALEAR
ncbi:MAG: type III secretion system stator protein SctL [Polyangiales bacterium]